MINYDVLICTYNGSEYIEEQIDSVLKQQVKPSKIIVSDDSPDQRTKEDVVKIFLKHNYSKFNIIDGPHDGVIKNFLKGIELSDADYLFLCDQDDIWTDNKIKTFLAYVNKTSVATLWYSDSILIDKDGKKLVESFFSYQNLTPRIFDDDSIIYKNVVQGATCCLNKSMCVLVSKVNKLVVFENLVMHDWWLALLAKYKGNSVYIDEKLVKYRQHQSNQVGAISKLKKIKSIFLNPLKYLRHLKVLKRQRMELIKIGFLDRKRRLQFKYVGNLKKIMIFTLKL